VSRGSITPSSQSRAVRVDGPALVLVLLAQRCADLGWPTSVMTVAACSPPITLMRALGHMKMKRGE
jgi:hypothetical protein